MSRRSNVTCASNIYVLEGDFRTDRKFQSMVRGRKSLRTMLKILAGLAWVQGEVSLDQYTHLLTDEQRKEWESGMYCAKLGDPEEIVMGRVKDENGYSVKCRCYRIDCPSFTQCRPDYVPGMELPVSPDQISTDGRDTELEPSVWPDWKNILETNDDNDEESSNDGESSIEEIFLEPEQVIPILEKEGTVLPDEKQESIVTGAVDELMLVLAGPGTGKTHSLLCKLEYMVDKKRMVEAGNVLLLCFTRAAVREIRDRFTAKVQSGDYSDDLSRIDIRTFDSFATRVLMDRNVECTGLDYNARIEKVIDEINGDPSILEEVEHFLVDEIQDLVGVRARLVQKILKNLPPGCGFTLFGDHLQAIYDYNVKNQPEELDSRGFMEWLRRHYGDSLRIIKLDKNRRQTSRLAVVSSRSRSILETEDKARIQEFSEIINGFPEVIGLNNIVPQKDSPEKVAVLCRNNGQVLKISGRLWQKRISHTVRTQHNKWLLPVWLGDLLSGQQQIVTRDDLVGLDLFGRSAVDDPDRLFGLLQDLARTSGRAIYLDKVRRALTTDARLPDELCEGPAFPLTVSTIHQAKGREFDRVYVFEPRIIGEIDDPLEEARVYYVALTRARNDFKRLMFTKTFTWLKPTEGTGRWIEIGKKRDGNLRLVGMEIGFGSDINEESFVDTRIPGLDPDETQRYIREEVKTGDPLSIIWLGDNDDSYGIYHRNRLIGRMSDYFTFGVREAMNTVYGRRYLPLSFSEVYVGRVYTIVKRPETISLNVTEPYITTGVWYGLSVAGMGKVRFDWY